MSGRPAARRTPAVYVLMLAFTVAVWLGIRACGVALHPTPAGGGLGPQAADGAVDVLAQVLLVLAVITLAARVAGAACERFLGQPPVMGEILAGLLLGPSGLGAVAPGIYAALLPAPAAAHLGTVAKIGVVFFMFLVGLDLDPRLLRGHTAAVLTIAHASIAAPFLLGSTLAIWLYPRYASGDVGFTVFSLFLGVSLSVTAFPVLARILTDRRLQRTPLGALALACAAVDDATAWCLLAMLSGAAQARTAGAGVVAALAVYVAVMVAVVRPLGARLARTAAAPLSATALAVVFAAVLLSALATQAIGIHALFGAFLLGVVLPHDGRLAAEVRARLEDLVTVLLLPVFFVATGMRTEIALVATGTDWLACGAILLAAVAGKFGGAFGAARLLGLGARDASALGILMNTRGLMELVVLNVGLDLGILSPTLFTMLVLMAIVTTFSTAPALAVVLRGGTVAATVH